jgi:hypothetical protein
VRIRYQETTGEDKGYFMCTAVTVIFRECKPVRLLHLLVVTSSVYKWSINRVSYPNPSAVTHTRGNIYVHTKR